MIVSRDLERLMDNRFLEDHGKEYQSEGVDKYLRETFFPDYDYKGIFIDIGAFHPIYMSNSYHFEQSGWNVVCIEANPLCIENLKKERKIVLNYAMDSEDKDNQNFCIVGSGDGTLGYMGAWSQLKKYYSRVGTFKCKNIVKVNTRKLDTLLKKELKFIDYIDIISIDTEGNEFDILNGFDIDKWRPKVFVIEEIKDENPKIKKYLKIFGYRIVNRIKFNNFYILD